MAISHQIRKIMSALCVSQKELSVRTGITTASICKYLNGSRQPSCAAVRKFVRFANENGLSLTYDNFLNDPEEENTNVTTTQDGRCSTP